jgi:uncharacterized protein
VILVADASAMVKLVLDEPGSEVIRRLWDEPVDWIAPTLVLPEGAAAVAAACRAGRLTQAQEQHAQAAFEAVIAEVALRILDASLATAAWDVARGFGLGGSDAVYLAVAQEFAAAEPVLVTFDARQREAAEAVGVALAPA